MSGHDDDVLRKAAAAIRTLRSYRQAVQHRPGSLAWERLNAELHGLEMAAVEIDPDSPRTFCPYCKREMLQMGLADHIRTHAGQMALLAMNPGGRTARAREGL